MKEVKETYGKRKDYSQNIIPMKHSIVFPDKTLSKFTHPAVDGKTFVQNEPLKKSEDNLDKFHSNNLSTSVLVNITKEGDYTLSSDFEDNVCESIVVKTSPATKANLFIHVRSKGFHSQYIDCALGANSELNLIILQNKSKGIYISKQHVQHSPNSKVNFVHIDVGSEKSIVEQISYLEGEGSMSNNYSLAVKKGEQKFDCNAEANHIGKETNSDINIALVLKDKSQTVLRGLVLIGKNAAKSTGYQTQTALLLSDKCKASSVPDLLIHNNDVSCSHSSSLSRIDEEAKFYIMSRGLSEEQSVDLLQKAFIKSHLKKSGIYCGLPEIEEGLLL